MSTPITPPTPSDTDAQTSPGTGSPPPSASPDRVAAPERRSRSELGVAIGLAVLAGVVGFDTLTQPEVSINVGVLGPRVAPTVVAIGLGLCALAIAVKVMRGEQPQPDDSEDVDLSAGTDWFALAALLAVLVGSAVLTPVLGFVITGAALFAALSFLLGARRIILTIAIAIALALAAFYAFRLGLGIPLPAGVLTGIL